MEGEGVQVLAIKCDVTSTEDINHAAEEAEKAFGKVDILVNCAGSSKDKGAWGVGGDGATLTNSASGFNSAISGAGGGGWYGGGGGSAAGWANSGKQMRFASGGGGGSSFIHGVSGYTRRDNMDYEATEFKFSSAGGTAGSRSGNGYATISFVS